jgi:hypothetical protein
MSASDQGPGPKGDSDPRVLDVEVDPVADSADERREHGDVSSPEDGEADQTREYRPLSAAALEGGADETREYRPLTVAMIAQRLATKQQLRGLAKLADLEPTERRHDPSPPPGTALRPRTSGPPLLAPRVAASAVPADPTLQLAPITSAFAAALAAPVGRPAGRTRWALPLAVLIAALPAGLLLYPTPKERPMPIQAAEPPPPARPPEPEPSAPAVTELVTPEITVSAPRPAHHPRRESAPKPEATEPAANPSPPDPAPTPER